MKISSSICLKGSYLSQQGRCQFFFYTPKPNMLCSPPLNDKTTYYLGHLLYKQDKTSICTLSKMTSVTIRHATLRIFEDEQQRIQIVNVILLFQAYRSTYYISTCILHLFILHTMQHIPLLEATNNCNHVLIWSNYVQLSIYKRSSL